MVPACLPVPPSLHVEALLLGADGLTILASSNATDAPCPLCGQRADRVHGLYVRTLADLPWATLAVQVRVQVRRFVCANDACPRWIFAERLAGPLPEPPRSTLSFVHPMCGRTRMSWRGLEGAAIGLNNDQFPKLVIEAGGGIAVDAAQPPRKWTRSCRSTRWRTGVVAQEREGQHG